MNPTKAHLYSIPKAVIQETILHVLPSHLDVGTIHAIAFFWRTATRGLVEHKI
jgi:hypothetical protein